MPILRFFRSGHPIQEAQKFATFLEAHEFISAHNARYLLGLETFDVAHNFLSDLSTEEYSVMTGFIPEELGRAAYGNSCQNAPSLGSQSNPSSVDWRDQGYVTPVKSQGQCSKKYGYAKFGVSRIRICKFFDQRIRIRAVYPLL